MLVVRFSTILLFILIPTYLFSKKFSTEWEYLFYFLLSLLALMGIVAVDLLPAFSRKPAYFYNLSKLGLLSFLLIIIILVPFLSGIQIRNQGNQYAFVHDSIVQTEEAIKYLLSGKNFYTEDYLNTPLANWSEGKLGQVFTKEIFLNPAVYHYIYLPFYVLFSVPFYLLFHFLFGWYDQRIVHLFVFFSFLILLFKIKGVNEKTFIASILIIFNPAFVNFFIEGRNDIFIIFWIMLTVYFLSQEKYRLSALSFALACVSKQFAWFLFPFFWIFIYYKNNPAGTTMIGRTKKTLRLIYPFFVVSAVIVLPFLIWDFPSFWQDVILYPSGKLPTSYPITGFGFSEFILILRLGVSTMYDYFPFWIIQLTVCFPLFVFLWKLQKKHNNLSQMLAGYGIFLFVFWFFSRYFNDSYFNYVIIIFILAYLVADSKNLAITE